MTHTKTWKTSKQAEATQNHPFVLRNYLMFFKTHLKSAKECFEEN